MTEINTDEIRAGLQGDDHPSTEAEIRALCDALDEARRDTRDMDEYDARWFALHAELDAVRALVDPDVWALFMEAGIQRARAEAAEARIANAMTSITRAAILRVEPDHHAIRRALTEGTDQ